MPLAAILSATAPCSDRPDGLRAQLIFAAQTLIEYQARQAVQAGADQIFVMVAAVTPALSRLVDRLASDGVQVHLVRDMAGLIRQLPRESDVLLLADGMIVDQKYILELGSSTGNTLLVAADDALTAQLERVDASDRWAGAARVAPRTLFNTLDLIGDWDLVLTVLRATVQSNPRRIAVSAADVSEGRVVLVDTQAAADLVGTSLAAPRSARETGGGIEQYVLHPLAVFGARRLLRMQIAADHILWTAIGTAALGLLCIVPGWTYAALLLFLASLLAGMVAQQVADMGRHGPRHTLVELVPAGLIAMGLAWLGAHWGAPDDGLHLAILCVVMAAAIRKRRTAPLPGWALMTPGSATVLLLLGLVVGRAVTALAFCALLAIASVSALLLIGKATEDRK